MISAPSFCASILAGARPLLSRSESRRMAPRAENGLSPPVATCCGDSNFFRLKQLPFDEVNRSISMESTHRLLCRRLSRTPNAIRFFRASCCCMVAMTARVVSSSHRSEKRGWISSAQPTSKATGSLWHETSGGQQWGKEKESHLGELHRCSSSH